MPILPLRGFGGSLLSFELFLLEMHVIFHSQMDKLVGFLCCIIYLFLSFLMLHLQHADTITEKLDVILNLILVLFNLTVGRGLLLH